MNANAFHNILNYVMALVAVLALQDWTTFGVSEDLALKLVAGFTLASTVLKTVVNITRDGLSGQFKEQPPVEK